MNVSQVVWRYVFSFMYGSVQQQPNDDDVVVSVAAVKVRVLIDPVRSKLLSNGGARPTTESFSRPPNVVGRPFFFLSFFNCSFSLNTRRWIQLEFVNNFPSVEWKRFPIATTEGGRKMLSPADFICRGLTLCLIRCRYIKYCQRLEVRPVYAKIDSHRCFSASNRHQPLKMNMQSVHKTPFIHCWQWKRVGKSGTERKKWSHWKS